MSKHDNLVDLQISRLKKGTIHRHFTYNQHGIIGEMDIMVEYPNNVREYYEIKSSTRPRCYRHAMRQFKHAKQAFPEYRWRFFYVTPKKIEQVTV
jgi:hypothetical protein